MRKRILRVLGLTMVLALIITSLPIQGIAFAMNNSLESSAVVSREGITLNHVVMTQSSNVAFLSNQQEIIMVGNGGFSIEFAVPERADLVLHFPDGEYVDIIKTEKTNFVVDAPIGTKVVATFTDDDDNGTSFEFVKVEYQNVQGKHPLPGPITIYFGQQHDPESGSTVIDYVTSWKESGPADTEAHVDVTPASQTFSGSLEITITSNDGSTIYYTDDGSEPSASSTPYTGPFNITDDTTVKAYAVDGSGNTATDMETYTVDNEANVMISPESQTFAGTLEITITSSLLLLTL